MRSKWRTFREHLSPPLFLIVAALVIIGVVGYVVVSQEDNSEAKLFEFQAGDSKISNLRIFSNAISEDDDARPFLVVELELDLLENSIKNNTYMPGGDQIQKYNYVVTEKGKISVAVWAVQDRYAYLYDPKKDLGSCIKDRDWSMSNESESERPDGDAPVMINIYPEFRDPKVSPCWVTLPSGENMGLLDGSSKHLILAQGQPVLLDEVNEGWKDAKVRGAGEIIVDLKNSCSYTVTDGSGTYKPNDLANLRSVALAIARSLGEGDSASVLPKYIKDKDEGLIFFEIYSNSVEDEESGTLSCP